MANFSPKERLIASLLSATPSLKQLIKKVYIGVNAIIYKKKYTSKILDERISQIESPLNEYGQESFFGYYDKSPITINNKLLSHCSIRKTHKKPNPNEPIDIVLVDVNRNIIKQIGQSSAYTWQQGSRSQWLNNDLLMYNAYEDNKYKSFVYSIENECIIKSFDYPVQDSFRTEYYLSINYQRMMNLRPDYGYRNLPLLGNDEMKDTENDGVWKIDFNSGKSLLLHSLSEIIACERKDLFDICLHKVNHLMINKLGDGFIFIHRFYQGRRRFDRLIYSDFTNLKVLVDDGMVSHCCWIDNNTIFGYFRYDGKNGYYYCNIQNGEITPCLTMTNLQVGDGHPSCFGDWIVFDSYPDKSRMQHLYLYNIKLDKVFPLLELFQSVKYMGESRCDLHPRFSHNGKMIFFDTVYSGKRTHSYIDVSEIVN